MNPMTETDGQAEAGDTPEAAAASPKKAGLSRFLPLAVIAGALAAFFGLGLDQYFTLETLKTYRTQLVEFAAAYPLLGPVGMALLYAALVAISFPGASLLTIFSGFMFGTLIGGAAVLVGATLGAALVFLAAKTALGDTLRSRAGPWLEKFEKGFQENEFNYMLILRLVPVFPFWVVNLAPALLGMKLRNYVAATFIGIIPGVFVYASVGAGAGAIIDEGGEVQLSGLLFKPEVYGPILGLMALALIPIVLKFFRRNKSSVTPAE